MPQYFIDLEKCKQKANIEFNKLIGVVDMTIILMAGIQSQSDKRTWFLCIFFHLLYISIINVWFLYLTDHRNKEIKCLESSIYELLTL